ncbi:MAG: hypothetical protein ABJB74_12380 [Gemmatimonas sp.]
MRNVLGVAVLKVLAIGLQLLLAVRIFATVPFVIVPFVIAPFVIAHAQSAPSYVSRPKRLAAIVESGDSISSQSVAWIAPRSDHGFYAYDRRSARIERFDEHGAFVRFIGKTGTGNGAYGELLGGAVVNDSLLTVWDPQNQRVIVFHESGGFQRNVRVPMESRGYASRAAFTQFVVDNEGAYYFRIQNAMGSNQYSWLRTKSDGTVLDSTSFTTSQHSAQYTSDGMRISFVPDIIRTPWQAGGMLVADPAAYHIEAVGVTASPLKIDRAHTPVPILAGEHDQWIAFLNRDNGRLSEATLDSAVPKFKTAFRNVLSDRSGNIWVELNSAAHADSTAYGALDRLKSVWRDVTRYDVFAPDGSWKYQVELPRQTYVIAVDGNRLWLHETDAKGKSVVAIYTL